jgi:anti-sigma regulatory factor (Ser/Thr protein kinase)
MGEHAIAAAPPGTRARVFAGRTDQVREARRFLGDVLDGCPLADDAALCLSELFTNSIVHGASGKTGGTVTVRAELRPGDYARIEVEDNGGPWLTHPQQDGRGHGLDILAALAAEWGIEGSQEGGWTVWARFDLSPAATDRTTA